MPNIVSLEKNRKAMKELFDFLKSKGKFANYESYEEWETEKYANDIIKSNEKKEQPVEEWIEEMNKLSAEQCSKEESDFLSEWTNEVDIKDVPF